MKNRKLITMIVSVMMAVMLLTGCAEEPMDGTQVAATVNGEEVSLGIANFAAKLQQAQTESYYMMFFGEGMWSQEAEEGKTLEEVTKESVMKMIQELYIVRSHADEYGVALTAEENQKIADAAAKFIADNSEIALEKLTATEEVVKEYFELVTIQKKVSEEIIKDVDTVVSDEEAAQRKIEYVYVSASTYVNDDGETVEYTEEEKAERMKLAETIITEAKEADDLDAAATAQGLTMSTVTYGADDTALVAELRDTVNTLKEGEYSGVIENQYGYYVAHVVSDFDAEATEEKKVEIVKDRENALYSEVYYAWEDSSELVVNEDVWAQVTFAAPITITSGVVEDSSEVQTYELDEDGEVVNSEDK